MGGELADAGGSGTKDVPPGPPLNRTLRVGSTTPSPSLLWTDPPQSLTSLQPKLGIGETLGGQQRSPRCHEEGNGKIEGTYPQDNLLRLQIWWRKEADTISYDGAARQTDNESHN
ncbi:hypothetical protein RHSIM_Rhsim08G0161900 [Rhododendron simsii]|uniref:Uncharacterized protein n=1 Tax=Rhododendron simsii TaxID=118357 RepID=A0A834GJA0_RHOSS|nr:hypothetical protein RHSIM_Rhsim08G0161900 [Rhododendron simsii]